MLFRYYNFYCPGCKRVMKRQVRVGQQSQTSYCNQSGRGVRLFRTNKRAT